MLESQLRKKSYLVRNVADTDSSSYNEDFSTSKNEDQIRRVESLEPSGASLFVLVTRIGTKIRTNFLTLVLF